MISSPSKIASEEEASKFDKILKDVKELLIDADAIEKIMKNVNKD